MASDVYHVNQHTSRRKGANSGTLCVLFFKDLNLIFLKTLTRGDTSSVISAPEKRQSGLSENLELAPRRAPGVTELGTGSPGAGLNTLQASKPQAQS